VLHAWNCLTEGGALQRPLICVSHFLNDARRVASAYCSNARLKKRDVFRLVLRRLLLQSGGNIQTRFLDILRLITRQTFVLFRPTATGE
jgi:hypothetical protein